MKFMFCRPFWGAGAHGLDDMWKLLCAAGHSYLTRIRRQWQKKQTDDGDQWPARPTMSASKINELIFAIVFLTR